MTTLTDYEILRTFLIYDARLIPSDFSKEQSDVIINTYVDFFCNIHIDYIQNTFPPARLYVETLGKNTIGKDMIVRKIIEDLKRKEMRPTMGDLYEDAFQILAPGIKKQDIPKTHPSKASKLIVEELQSQGLLLKYAKFINHSAPKKQLKPIVLFIMWAVIIAAVIGGAILIISSPLLGLCVIALGILIVLIKKK